jgi:hypothetical protein
LRRRGECSSAGVTMRPDKTSEMYFWSRVKKLVQIDIRALSWVAGKIDLYLATLLDITQAI